MEVIPFEYHAKFVPQGPSQLHAARGERAESAGRAMALTEAVPRLGIAGDPGGLDILEQAPGLVAEVRHLLAGVDGAAPVLESF
jgi:hypothetical protein